MPLLNGEQFVKKPLPPHMKPDDEVFFSPITFEIFQDYDEFFERTILLNSATWNCSFCNKSQLTYNEAVACEKSDLDQLNNFGVSLCRGLLYITFQARRRKLSELVDLLHGFVHYRFFIGESVFVKRSDFKTATNQCVVVERVLPPPGRDSKKTEDHPSATTPDGMHRASELPDPSVIKYVVKRSTAAGPEGCSAPENSSSMILSGSVLQRGPKNFLTRDKIKFFIRQTCHLEFSVFKPKKTIMEHFNLEPFGSLSWTDFFVAPEPLWHQLAPPPVALLKPKLLRIDAPPSKTLPSHQGAQMVKMGGKNDCSNTSSGSGGGPPPKKVAFTRIPPSQQQHPKIVVDIVGAQAFEESQAQAARAARIAALDADRLLRMERADLERDWALLRKRDDLELSDLVPLPDFSEINTRLPVEEFGRAIQTLEFLNIYGPMLKLPMPGFQNSCLAAAAELVTGSPSIPDAYTAPCLLDGTTNKMTWGLLEDMLFNCDPTGAFTDCLMGLLSAVRTLEHESGARQSSPTAEAAAASAVSAIATLEAGLPLAYAGCLTGLGSSAEYTTMFADTLLANRGALIPAFSTAATATRDCELVGVPPLSAISTRADKAAMALAAATAAAATTNTSSDPTVLGLPQAVESGVPAICGKSSAVRAAATAAAVGAASLPPLDRAGLSEALWLHIATAPAKAGGWRGTIWGGTRPLDDPCIALMRDNPGLVQKLRSVPVFSWPPSEKLLILTVLMDELLLQPQLRDRMEENLEKLRGLRLQLRSIQAERFKLYGGSASIAATLYGFSPSALVSSGDNWLTGTPPILRAQLARGRRKPPVGTASSDAAKTALKPTNLSTTDVKGSTSNPPAVDTKSEPACPTGEEGVPPVDAGAGGTNNDIKHPLCTFGEELDLEENELWQTMLSVACNCSMIPLGQDRVYRRYWLVLSLPALLVESTAGEMTEIPGMPAAARNVSLRPSLRVRGRQVAKSLTLGSSPAEAAEALNAAVKTLLMTPVEDLQWQNPGLLDRDSLISQLAIDLPNNREQLSLEQLRILVHPERRGSVTVDANHPAVLQVEKLQANCPRWAVLLPVPASKSQPSTSIKPEADGTSSMAELSYADRYERASAAVTQLEASLNPRGQREGRLRKSISQLRPLLIQAVADCPAELLTSMSSQTSAESGRTPKPKWEEVVFSWLECTIHGVGMRLGLDSSLLQDLLKPLPPCASSDTGEHKNDPENASVEHCTGGGGNPADASHRLEAPAASTIYAKTSVASKNQSPAEVPPTGLLTSTLLRSVLTDSGLGRGKPLADRVNQTEPTAPASSPAFGDCRKVSPSPSVTAEDTQPKVSSAIDLAPSSLTGQAFSDRLRRLADIVTSLGLALGPRRLAGPLSNDERSIRGLQASRSTPSLSTINGAAAEDSASSSSQQQRGDSPAPPADAAEDSGLTHSLPVQTTGWQRWLSSVASTTSISQLHLLTRALERAARRAVRGGRGVPAAIFSYASQIPLPEIRCTACGGPPDPNPTPTRVGSSSVLAGNFSVCSACACPFHLDCLLCSRARASTSSSSASTRNFRPRAGARVSAQLSRAAELSALPLARHLVSPYTLVGACLGSAPATRLELTGLCLLLCDRCRRLAGHPVAETFVEASATCITGGSPTGPAPSVIVDVEMAAVVSTDTAASATATAPADSPLGAMSDDSITTAPRRTSQSAVHDNGPPTAFVAAASFFSPRQKRGRPAVVGRGSGGGGRGRGRPPKRPRIARHLTNHTDSSADRGKPEVDEECLEVGKPNGAEVFKRNPADCVHYDDEEDAFLQERRHSGHHHLVTSSPHLNGEVVKKSVKSTAAVGRGRRSGALLSPASTNAQEEPVSTCASEFGLNHQAAAERFLAEISSLSVARPLIRCALGRTVLAAEERSSSNPWPTPPSPQAPIGDSNSYRTRRSTQSSGGDGDAGTGDDRCSSSLGASSLYAYDLDGLTDLLSRKALPRGPGEVVTQLRLLIKHFISSNRPGSRLHHCAQDLSVYVERRLAELVEKNSAVGNEDRPTPP